MDRNRTKSSGTPASNVAGNYVEETIAPKTLRSTNTEEEEEEDIVIEYGND